MVNQLINNNRIFKGRINGIGAANTFIDFNVFKPLNILFIW